MVTRGDDVAIKEMCQIFDGIQDGATLTSTFDSGGVRDALGARIKPSKTTATDTAPKERSDTAAGASALIVTSSTLNLLVLRHSLFKMRSTCFYLHLCSAPKSGGKHPPIWQRSDYASP